MEATDTFHLDEQRPVDLDVELVGAGDREALVGDTNRALLHAGEPACPQFVDETLAIG
jgi:hypothetical protein